MKNTYKRSWQRYTSKSIGFDLNLDLCSLVSWTFENRKERRNLYHFFSSLHAKSKIMSAASCMSKGRDEFEYSDVLRPITFIHFSFYMKNVF